MLLATSCSQEELVSNPAGDGNVNISVSLPKAMGTRAFADGLSATQLQVAVYDATTENLVTSQDYSFDPASLSTTISLSLAQGRAYKIAFFASPAAGDVYTLDTDAKTISVDYTKMTAYNSNDYDCFYKLEDIPTVTGPVTRSVTLTRPVAQINWGTNDLDEGAVIADDNYGAGAAKLVSKMTAKAYSTFNLFTSDVDADSQVDVEFPYLARPAATEAFPVEDYDYVSMQYLLVPQESSVVDLKLEATNDATGAVQSTVLVTNAPVQANYRTNIYGALLTTPSNFTVTKEINFTDDIYQPIEVEAPAENADGTYSVSTPQQLAYVAQNPSDWKGKTIVLDNDIDLGGMAWQPIGSNIVADASSNNMNWFEGTFDGNNHTISNFRCDASGDYAVAGLFGALRGVVKNLTVENAYISSTHYAGAIVAYSHNNNSATYGDGKTYPATGYAIENCKVINSTIKTTPNRQADGSYDNGDKAGAVIGYANSIFTVSGCEVSNCTVEAYRDLGALVGYVGGKSTSDLPIKLDNNKVTDVKLIQNFTNGYKEVSAVKDRHGVWYGWKDYEPTSCSGNTDSNITFTTKADDSAALRTLLASAYDGIQIELAATAYSTKNLTFAKDVAITFNGQGADKTSINAEPYPAAHGCDLTFNNLAIVTTKMAGTEMGFYHTKKTTYNNVTIKGEIFTYASEGETFNNCTFVPNAVNGPSKYSVWCYGAQKTAFNDCVFNNNVGKGILVYNHGDNLGTYDIAVTDCRFNVQSDGTTATVTDKGAIEIHTETFTSNTKGTVKIANTTYSAAYGGGLWKEVHNTAPVEPTTFFTIVVDNETVQTGTR